MTEHELASIAELDAIDAQVVKEIDEAYEFAKNSPAPDLSVAFEDVWVD